MRVPLRWHACRLQTVELRRVGGSVTGILFCACGAFTDRTGRWVGRNLRRRTHKPAGLHRKPDTPQSVRAPVVTGIPHPGASPVLPTPMVFRENHVKRAKSKTSRGLETRHIVYGNRRRPHDRPQELKVDVRRDDVMDIDYAAAMVAVRTPIPLADVMIIKVVGSDGTLL